MSEPRRPSPRPRPGPAVPTVAPARRSRRPRLRAAWSEASARVTAREAAQAEAARRARRRWEPPIDPSSWSGALITVCAIAAALWVVRLVDTAADLDLAQYGIGPRRLDGLRGVLVAPFVSDSGRHLLSDTVPFVAIGWVVLLAGVRVWAAVTAAVWLVGGLAAWSIGPSGHVLVGVTGVVFGWLGYLIARAVFSRRLKWIVVAAVVVGFFGSLLYGLFPTLGAAGSWQLHVCGFAAGVAVGAALHPRGATLRRLGRSAVQ